jgi:uncharacterized protein (UPF0248 family)
MIPIHELLARIRWDAAYARSRFVIGYWDRVAGKVLHADLREIAWDADNPAFSIWWTRRGWRTASRSTGCGRCGGTAA